MTKPTTMTEWLLLLVAALTLCLLVTTLMQGARAAAADPPAASAGGDKPKDGDKKGVGGAPDQAALHAWLQDIGMPAEVAKLRWSGADVHLRSADGRQRVHVQWGEVPSAPAAPKAPVARRLPPPRPPPPPWAHRPPPPPPPPAHPPVPMM